MTAGELRDALVDLKLSRSALMDSPFVLVTPDADNAECPAGRVHADTDEDGFFAGRAGGGLTA